MHAGAAVAGATSERGSERSVGGGLWRLGALYLPTGIPQGFVSVTLGYLLGEAKIDLAAVAAIVSLNLLPLTLRFVAGAVVDLTLSPRRWFLIALAGLCGGFVLSASIPLSPPGLPLMSAVALLLGVAMVTLQSANDAMVAATVPVEARGRAAGWAQAGNIGGIGLGGGLGLWLATETGSLLVAGAGTAALCLIASLPIVTLRADVEHGETVAARLRSTLAALRAILPTRSGFVTALAVTMPMGLGVSLVLLPAAAATWHASAELVAVTTGTLAGLLGIPGCLFGGWLCDRFPKLRVFAVSVLLVSAGLAAMALLPPTPTVYAVFVVVIAVLVGMSWASYLSVVFELLPRGAAATVSALFGSLSNLPYVGLTAWIGGVAATSGPRAMLLTEAGIGMVSLIVFVIVLGVSGVWAGQRALAR